MKHTVPLGGPKHDGPRVQKCRHTFCQNRYDDVIGMGERKTGAVCLPCHFAERLIEEQRTPVEVKSHATLFDAMTQFLYATGWKWEHVETSFRLLNTAASTLIN